MLTRNLRSQIYPFFARFSKKIKILCTSLTLPLTLIFRFSFLSTQKYVRVIKSQSIQHISLDKHILFFTLIIPKLVKHQLEKKYYSLVRLNGLGYRAWRTKNHYVVFELGYSHYVCLMTRFLPLTLVIRKDKILIIATEKSQFGQFVRFLKNLKPINPYSLKGVRVVKQPQRKKLKKKDRAR